MVSNNQVDLDAPEELQRRRAVCGGHNLIAST